GPRPAPARAAGGIPPHAPGDAPAAGRLLPPGLAAHPRRLSQPDPPSPRALPAGGVGRARTPAPPRAGAQFPKYLPLRAAPSPNRSHRAERDLGWRRGDLGFGS